ncbi:ABC transporter ATP-binding protein [Kineosporia succinea]|uniref:ATP-binding cassette subfamily B protein n=1 Tax=Kineosporia succinea TaxID=84632 RepID=A0ABT9NVU3_9ACTN|nr:ABC transporter ATP-binding protein [Kineosporia succinea]MDP9824543.1 ATP-binding cassette subfamily B protein [Kineosporia succinea]
MVSPVPSGEVPTPGADPVPDEATDPPRLTWPQVLRRFWPLTRGRRAAMAGALLAFTLAVVADAIGIELLSTLIDGAVEDADLSQFWHPAAIWAGITLCAAALTYLGSVLTASAAERFSRRLRAQTHDHLLTVAPEELDRRALGDVLSRVVDDTEDVEHLTVTGIIDAAGSALAVVIFGIAAWRQSWMLALVVLAAAPVIWLLNRWLTDRTHRFSMRTRVAHGALTSALEQSLTNSALVQAYNARPAERRRLSLVSGRLMTARLRQTRLAAVQGPLTELVETAGLLAVIGIGVIDIATGDLTVGGLLAFTAYLTFLYPPITALGQLGLTASSSGTSAARLVELLDLTPAVRELEPAAGADRRVHHSPPPNPDPTTDPTAALRPVPLARPDLVIENVTVRSPGRADRLSDVSLRIPAGALVMVTGPSGAGKSTLVELLVRFRDPDTGRVLLAGRDLRDFPLEELRDQVTLLPQEPFMFDETVRENITYGVARDPGTDAIRIAAQDSGAEEFLKRLPEGLATPVGQRGRALSGGQRQRLALARALLRGGPVLVLDEPTTGLDPQAADDLITTLRLLTEQGRTVLLVTHDRELTRRADQVVEIRAGRVHRSSVSPHSRTRPIRVGQRLGHSTGLVAVPDASPEPRTSEPRISEPRTSEPWTTGPRTFGHPPDARPSPGRRRTEPPKATTTRSQLIRRERAQEQNQAPAQPS